MMKTNDVESLEIVVDYEYIVNLVGTLSTVELAQLSNLIDDLLDKDLG